MPTQHSPHAVIIGAGFTGCALAYDLAQRGFAVTVLERGEIASGTSGRTHGLLHSGARYCTDDQEAARECIQENRILRKIAAQCIEFNGGLFVALDDSDLSYAPRFAAGAQACDIDIEELTPAQALQLEPNLNPQVRMAYRVPDGAFDPLRLALAFAASACQLGAEFKPYHEVTGFLVDGQGAVTGLNVTDRHARQAYQQPADIVINATGAWAGHLAAMIGLTVPVTPAPGVMVAYNRRLIQRVINRLNAPGDGDILIPQRRMVVIGTTSFKVQDADYIPVFPEQVEEMHRKAMELIPAVAQTAERGAYMSARPLIGTAEDERSLTRTFKCYDHAQGGQVERLVTITGGKATTCRAMAEKTADLVCQKLGISAACQTAEQPLASYRLYYSA